MSHKNNAYMEGRECGQNYFESGHGWQDYPGNEDEMIQFKNETGYDDKQIDDFF